MDATAQPDSKTPATHWKTQLKYSTQEFPKVEANSLLHLWAKTFVGVVAVLVNTKLNQTTGR